MSGGHAISPPPAAARRRGRFWAFVALTGIKIQTMAHLRGSSFDGHNKEQSFINFDTITKLSTTGQEGRWDIFCRAQKHTIKKKKKNDNTEYDIRRRELPLARHFLRIHEDTQFIEGGSFCQQISRRSRWNWRNLTDYIAIRSLETCSSYLGINTLYSTLSGAKKRRE